MVATCPSQEELQAFQLGDLPEPSLTEIAEHLETCVRCETLAQELDSASDAIMAALREPIVRPSPGRSRILKVAAYPFLSPPKEKVEIGRLGAYRVLDLLDKGGMAFVFRAEDLALKRPVALKVMKPKLDDDAIAGERFLREARILASIKHDNLVTVYQAGEENGVVYLAMELLAGESLDQRIKQRRPTRNEDLLRLARELTCGLAAIHGLGLIHRDIKPANIWLQSPDDAVKILDFGLARFVHDDGHLTQTGAILGTPSFMSPEQASGAPTDKRTDVYSLGAVFYYLCTGSKPFQAENTMALLSALAIKTPQPAHEINPELPRAFSDLIMQLLAKKPEDRPASAEVVLERLKQLRSGSTEKTRVERPRSEAVVASGPPSEPSSVRRLALQWGGGLLLTGLAVWVVLYLTSDRAQQPAISKGPTGPAPRLPAPVEGPQASTQFYLTDLQPMATENWPFPNAPFPDDVFHMGNASPHGIFMHPPPPPHEGQPTSLTYLLARQYRSFRATVSINDGVPRSLSPMTFTVYGDGKMLWQSQPVSTQQDTQTCEKSVVGVESMKIEVRIAGRDIGGAHGVWIEPYLAK